MENNFDTYEIESKEIIEQTFNDPETKKKLDDLAIAFNTVSRGKWNTISFFKRKLGFKDEETKMYLDLLVMSKRALSKKSGDVLLYRITLNKEQRKKVISNYINELKSTIENLEKELITL